MQMSKRTANARKRIIKLGEKKNQNKKSDR
jgi:hypothetical protein